MWLQWLPETASHTSNLAHCQQKRLESRLDVRRRPDIRMIALDKQPEMLALLRAKPAALANLKSASPSEAEEQANVWGKAGSRKAGG